MNHFYYNQAAGAPGMAPFQAAAAAGRGMGPAQMGIPPTHYMQPGTFRNMPAVADPAAMHRKRHPNKAGIPMADENDDPSGDELDDISARDIAMARYKRNHDYLSEIFTPYNAASITPPSLDIQQSKEELLNTITKYETETKSTEHNYSEKLVTLQKEKQDYWKLLSELSEASSLEAIENTRNKFGEHWNAKLVQVRDKVHAVTIPGREAELLEASSAQQRTENRSPEEQPQQQQPSGYVQGFLDSATTGQGAERAVSNATPMGMLNQYNTNVQQSDQGLPGGGEEDPSNDFFNQMVNTGQDDDSVSEFLNTTDMDFEQSDRPEESGATTKEEQSI